MKFMQHLYLSQDQWQLDMIGVMLGRARKTYLSWSELEMVRCVFTGLKNNEKTLLLFPFSLKLTILTAVKYKQDSVGTLKKTFSPHLCIIFILPRTLVTCCLIGIILFMTGRHSGT